MSDKLISLESVLKETRRFKGYIDDDMIERFSIAFKRLTPIEQPMSAVEYARVLYEMGDPDLDDGAFTDWLVAHHNEDFEEAVAIVEKWAREHPERSEESQEAAGNADADA